MKGPHHVKKILGATGHRLTTASTATAQSICGKRNDIISQLERKSPHGEHRRSVGVQQGRGVVEVYASAESGTWRILVTDARGMSCLMAAGEGFEVIEIEDGEPT